MVSEKTLNKQATIYQMYPYHNKIKQRIRNNELTRYEYVNKYKSISPCLLLYFETEPRLRPIRKHRFEEYEALLKEIFFNNTPAGL